MSQPTEAMIGYAVLRLSFGFLPKVRQQEERKRFNCSYYSLDTICHHGSVIFTKVRHIILINSCITQFLPNTAAWEECAYLFLVRAMSWFGGLEVLVTSSFLHQIMFLRSLRLFYFRNCWHFDLFTFWPFHFWPFHFWHFHFWPFHFWPFNLLTFWPFALLTFCWVLYYVME